MIATHKLLICFLPNPKQNVAQRSQQQQRGLLQQLQGEREREGEEGRRREEGRKEGELYVKHKSIKRKEISSAYGRTIPGFLLNKTSVSVLWKF